MPKNIVATFLDLLSKIIDPVEKKSKEKSSPNEDKEQQSHVTKGLLEILYEDGSHSGNGLLLNENGLALTCCHCLNVPLSQIYIKHRNGKNFKVLRIIAKDEKNDLALCLIDTYRIAQKKYYEISNLGAYIEKNAINVSILTLRNGKLVIRDGVSELIRKTVNVEKINRQTLIEMNIFCAKGDSGGVVVDKDGHVLGIFNSGSINGLTGYMIPWENVLIFLKKIPTAF